MTLRAFIFVAALLANREIHRRVEIKLELPPIQWIEPIGSDTEELQTA